MNRFGCAPRGGIAHGMTTPHRPRAAAESGARGPIQSTSAGILRCAGTLRCASHRACARSGLSAAALVACTLVSGGLGGCKSAPADGVWRYTSDRFDVTVGSLEDGTFRVRLSRAELTLEQSSKLSALDLLPASDAGSCPEDAVVAQVSVREEDGTSAEYRAVDGDCAAGDDLLPYADVLAVTGAAQCLQSKSYDASRAAEPVPLPLESACGHGLFSEADTPRSWWFQVDIPAGASYTFTLSDCYDRALALSLTDAFNGAELDRAETPPAGWLMSDVVEEDKTAPTEECLSVSHRSVFPGSLLLQVQLLSGEVEGDFYLYARREPTSASL